MTVPGVPTERPPTTRADRAPADDGVEEFHRLALVVEEERGRGLQRRRFAAVERDDAFCRRVVIDEERAAAEAGGLRLYEAEHALDGDHGVDGAAAFGQHFFAGLRRQRMGGGHHVFVRRDDFCRRKAGRAFGRNGVRSLLGGRSRGGQQEKPEGDEGSFHRDNLRLARV